MNTQSAMTLPWFVRYIGVNLAVGHAIGFGMVLATATDWGRAYGLGIGAVTIFLTSTVFTVVAVVLWLRLRAKRSEDSRRSVL